jgi:hypothetical protein
VTECYLILSYYIHFNCFSDRTLHEEKLIWIKLWSVSGDKISELMTQWQIYQNDSFEGGKMVSIVTEEWNAKQKYHTDGVSHIT